MTTQTFTWGEHLYLAIHRYPGGMVGVTKRLTDALGAVADSRATLQKLTKVENVDAMTNVQRWRAYQVLVVIGEDPTAWGVTDPGVPPLMVDYFHAALNGTTAPPTGPRPVTESKAASRNARKTIRDTAKRRNMVYSSVVAA